MIGTICFSIILLQALIAGVFYLNHANRKKEEELDRITSLSIIVPFHNEEKRIQQLVTSLNKIDLKDDRELIFINDYSTDRTEDFIKSRLKHPYKIFPNQYRRGKKWAIKTGVENASFDWVLTLDADVSFDNVYWDKLCQIPKVDIITLPVQFTGNSVVSNWAKIEHAFLRFFQNGMSAFDSPVLGSGANLCFSKEAFLDVDANRDDYNLKSGDDVFLIESMRKGNKHMFDITDPNHQVLTPAPNNWRALFKQRFRWQSKMTKMNTWALLPAGLFLGMVQLSFFGCLWMSFIEPIYLIPILVKILVELFIVSRYYDLQTKLIGLTIINQVTYLLILVMGIFPWGTEEKWQVQD